MSFLRAQPHIAVVDDDLSVRRSLARLIRSFGYEVETFESAEAFLEADRSAAPDCLVLDLYMPGLSGFDLLDRLRQEGAPSAVVFITAHADAATRERALASGAVNLLAKPFSDAELKDDLERAVELMHRRTPLGDSPTNNPAN